MFSPPIINDYINQLEALKRDDKENTKDSEDIYGKYNKVYGTLNESLLDNVDIDSLNNSWLLNFIGRYYYNKKDYPKAIEWYIKSSNLDNSESMNRLGIYYGDIENDYLKAIEWSLKSANLGNTYAMNNLGNYYYIEKNDYLKAIEWYTKSANLGNNGNSWYYLEIIKINETDYDYVFDLLQKYEGKIRNILLNKLSKEYIESKYQEIINNLKSVKTQGIDKVLINSILKHF